MSKMKWTTQGLQQAELIKMDMDTVDVTILRFILDFFNTGKMYTKIVSNKIYFWIHYQTIIDSLPILRINNKRNIARRFTKYTENNLLEKHVVAGIDEYMNKGERLKREGTYTYFYLNPDNLEILLGGCTFEYRGVDSKVQGGCTEEYRGGVPESTYKDSSIIDSSNIDSCFNFKKNYNYLFESGHITYVCYDENIYMIQSGKGENFPPDQVLTYLKRSYGDKYPEVEAVQKIKEIYNIS